MAKIAGPDGAEVHTGEQGEILLRGPMITKGYWKNPEATRAAITPDGWLHTGDVGKIDEEGFVYVLDRLKDVITSSGGSLKLRSSECPIPLWGRRCVEYSESGKKIDKEESNALFYGLRSARKTGSFHQLA